MALRVFRSCSRFCHVADKFGYISRRFLLSEAYSCREAWTNHLRSPLMQKINSYEFATKLQEAFDRNVNPTAIDMDILAHKVGDLDPIQLDFVQNLFYRFRHSSEAKAVRKSMSHALVRALLDIGEIERLLLVLKDKIHYGIFLDYYAANLLMDYFLKKGLHKEAGDIAIDLMLQEDFGHPLTRALAGHACHLRLKELLATPEELPAREENAEEEVKYRRIRYIMEPWYDDHFDIPTERQRLGKTLTMVAKLEGDSLLSRGLQLVGWGFYEKFDKGLSLIEAVLESNDGPAFTQSELNTFGSLIESVGTKEPGPPIEPGLLTMKDLHPFVTAEQKSQYQRRFQELTEQLKRSGKIAPGDVPIEDELLKLVKERIKTFEPIDIADQERLFAEWEQERTALLEEQIRRYQVEQKKRDIAERLLSLRSKEEKLRYFEKQAEMDLRISEQPTMKPIEDVVEEEQYVAPPGERKSDAAKKS